MAEEFLYRPDLEPKRDWKWTGDIPDDSIPFYMTVPEPDTDTGRRALKAQKILNGLITTMKMSKYIPGLDEILPQSLLPLTTDLPRIVTPTTTDPTPRTIDPKITINNPKPKILHTEDEEMYIDIELFPPDDETKDPTDPTIDNPDGTGGDPNDPGNDTVDTNVDYGDDPPEVVYDDPPEVVYDDPELREAIESGELPDASWQDNGYDVTMKDPDNPATLAERQYKDETLSIREEFTEALHDMFQRHIQHQLAVMQECGFSKFEEMTRYFDADAVEVKDESLVPIRDTIIRSQITRDQKTRLFAKTHGIDQTLYHMRTTTAAAELRKRYYSKKYEDPSTMTDQAVNSTVLSGRELYDQRYIQSQTGMYKHLMGSTKLMEEIMSQVREESTAKGKLLKSGVNIYKKKKYNITAVGDSSMVGGAYKEPAKSSSSSNSPSSSSSSSSGPTQSSDTYQKPSTTETGVAKTPSGAVGQIIGDPGAGDEGGDSNWHPKEFGEQTKESQNLYDKNGYLGDIQPQTKDAAVRLADEWNKQNPSDPLLVTAGIKTGAHSGGMKVDICSPGIDGSKETRLKFMEFAAKQGWEVLNEYNRENMGKGTTAPHMDLKYVG